MFFMIHVFLMRVLTYHLHLNYRIWGHQDKVKQSQSRMETIDSKFFSSANEILSTKQWNLNLLTRCEKFRLYNVNLTIKF